MSLIDDIAAALKNISDTPLTDARFFCAYYHDNPDPEQIADFIQRRTAGEPVAKIIRQKGFWKRDFYVSSDVLDPRPDSETMIEAVRHVFLETETPYRILDVGTGSGCLILSLLDEYPLMKGVGIDISKKALAIAKKNDKSGQISFIQKNFYTDPLDELGQFDIIISNPPYIPTADIEKLDSSVRLYDPKIALDGGIDGLKAYRKLACALKPLCTVKTRVFFEIGLNQEEAVFKIMEKEGWKPFQTFRDLGGVLRILCFLPVRL